MNLFIRIINLIWFGAFSNALHASIVHHSVWGIVISSLAMIFNAWSVLFFIDEDKALLTININKTENKEW